MTLAKKYFLGDPDGNASLSSKEGVMTNYDLCQTCLTKLHRTIRFTATQDVVSMIRFKMHLLGYTEKDVDFPTPEGTLIRIAYEKTTRSVSFDYSIENSTFGRKLTFPKDRDAMASLVPEWVLPPFVQDLINDNQDESADMLPFDNEEKCND